MTTIGNQSLLSWGNFENLSELFYPRSQDLEYLYTNPWESLVEACWVGSGEEGWRAELIPQDLQLLIECGESGLLRSARALRLREADTLAAGT